MLRQKLWFCLLLSVVIGIGVLLFSHRCNDGPAPKTRISQPPPPENVKPSKAFVDIGGDLQPGYRPYGFVKISEFPQGMGYVLRGTVTSKQNEPLIGATVSLYDSRPLAPKYEWPTPVASGTCDSEGRYQLETNLAIPNAVIAVRKPGYETVEDFQELIEPRIIVKDYRLGQAPGCVKGRILDIGGNPIAGAIVEPSIMQSGFTGDLSHFFGEVRIADSAGGFSLANLPESMVNIHISAQGHLGRTETINVRTGPCTEMDVYLQDANTVSFLVKNRRGSAIPTAVGTLTVSPLSRRSMQKGDEPGKLVWVAPLDAVPVICIVSARGYESSTFTLDPNASPMEVVLEEAMLLQGIVTAESGVPLLGARVNVFGTLRDKSKLPRAFEGTVETGPDGRFSLPLSYPPVREVRVTKRGYAERKLIYESQIIPATLKISLSPEGSGIFGRVSDDTNDPIRQFSVSLISTSSPGSPVYTRYFDSVDGRFVLPDVSPGLYEVRFRASSPLLRPISFGSLEIRAGQMYGEMSVRLSSAKADK